ncbi:MAG: type IV toxin-antitoxin system AbiEi family antitoxin domain-containing protein [Streptococcus sp.]|nr:type IV toxin-antitoxin system AbiEi family antitoxin domain-containing protein [Streptococcus sp.]
MNAKQTEIMEYLKRNNGILSYREVKEAGLSYRTYRKMIEQEELEPLGKGLYGLAEHYMDDWYLIQLRNSKGVYALDTALWLHGLSLTVPFEKTMMFPYGVNTSTIKQAQEVKPVVTRTNFDVGIVEIERQKGQQIRIYEIERTLVECLRPVYKMDVQLIAQAFKLYFQKYSVNYQKLMYYAKLFRVTDKIYSYIEVLS